MSLKYIFAGVDRSVRDFEVAVENGAELFLMSYYHIKSRKAWKQHVKRLGVKLIVDSGAFTAWKNDAEINVEEYADFLEKHADAITAYFNLDVVGDAAASRKNAEYLRSRGLKPIEVFHVGDDVENLDALVEEGHPLIAIGGSVGMSEKERKKHFDAIFDRHPSQNFHFLGGGSSKLLTSYGWYSADATTWLSSRKYNKVTDHNGQRKQPELSGLECMRRTVKYYVSLTAS